MSTYYYLVNDSKRKKYHIDFFIKELQITRNPVVQMAFVNVMFTNKFDIFRIIDDCADDVSDEYESINLMYSNDLDDDTKNVILKYINDKQ